MLSSAFAPAEERLVLYQPRAAKQSDTFSVNCTRVFLSVFVDRENVRNVKCMRKKGAQKLNELVFRAER